MSADNLLQDPLSAVLADGLHAHALHKAQCAATDAQGRTVIHALRAALRPLLPRMMALPILYAAPKLLRDLQAEREGTDAIDAALRGRYGESADATTTVVHLRLGSSSSCGSGRILTMRVPNVQERSYDKLPPYIEITESTDDRYTKLLNDPARVTYPLDAPPSEVIARFCAMFAKHVDFAKVQA